jgi:phage terminase large subunit GpA-like protein
MNAPTGSPTPREGAGGPLPFASTRAALARALPALAPPRRILPAEAAEKWRRVGTMGARQPWRNSTVPYMVEPANMTASRRYKGLVFAGPARSGKTDGLVLNPLLHRALCAPSNALVVHINRDSAQDFSIEKVAPMVRGCPELLARLGTDNIFEKGFAGGMRLTIGWPVIGKLSARDIPLVIFTDYDRLPVNVDGEGDPWSLGRKRTQTFGSQGMTIAESSPGRPILDEDWKPDPAHPHRPPPTTGILALFDEGTRGRWYWRCDECREEFEPTFDRLIYPRQGTPLQRGKAAVMACPHCGGLHEPNRKPALNEAGRWLHEADDGSLVPIEAGARSTDVVSYWLQGPAAAFQTWAELVSLYETALAAFATTGDEEKLKTTVNVDQGRPHRPASLGAGAGLSPAGLKAAAERRPKGLVPAGARFLTVSLDTQATRWVGQVDAWGEGLERWLVDRFEVVTPPALAPGGERSVSPARYGEDWAALDPILDRVYPVEGGGYLLGVAALIVDSGGEPGVTEKAYGFYRRMAKSHPRRVFLAKGIGGFSRPRAIEAEPEKVLGKKGAKARGLRLVQVATDRLKDEVVASLARTEPGPGAYHLSADLPDQVFEEFCAERREADGWKVKEGVRRNEALDLAVYGKALAIVLKAETVAWSNPPAWCAPLAANAFARIVEAAPRPPAAPSEPAAEAVAPAPLIHPVTPPARVRRVRSRGI